MSTYVEMTLAFRLPDGLDTQPCAFCGTRFIPSRNQEALKARGTLLYCCEGHRIAMYQDDYWSGRQLACCGQFHAITAIPMRVPCCGKTWLTEQAQP